jgi:DNA-binding NarL/FixJ family response regulator
MNMPGLSGAEVLAKIRSAAPDVPTIIMSGHSVDESCVQDVIAQFQCGYLAKPSDGEAILKAVAAVLAKRKGPAAIAA